MTISSKDGKCVVEMACVNTGCDYEADWTLSAREQWDDMLIHLDETHFLHRRTRNVTIIMKIWDELDAYTTRAMEWPKFPAYPEDPWASNEDMEKHRIAELENEIAKTKETAAGRGLAIGLYHLLTPHFDDPTAVVKHAVARYKAKKAGEQIRTPGLDNVPTPAAAALQRKQTPAAAKPAVNLADLPADKLPELSEKKIKSILGSLAAEMEIKDVAEMFDITVAQVKEIQKNNA